MNTIGSYVFIDTSVFQEEGFFKPSGKVSKLFNLAENGKLNILCLLYTSDAADD